MQNLLGIQLTSVAPHWPRQLSGKVDFAFIDCEHHCFSREQVAWLCIAYRSVGIAPVVRVLEPRSALVRACIDDGAEAVVVPYVESVAQAREVVAAAKLRPVQGERASAAMSGQPLETDLQTMVDQHCQNVSLILQIESTTAVDRCEDLLSIQGVDGAMVGPFDLTATLSCLGDHQNPKFVEAITRVADVCRSLEKIAGIYFADSPAKEVWARELGYRMIIAGCDINLIGEALELRRRD
ncbi:HpcH/HpaI aldolase family protein [Rubripirellula obstinata]|uniref:HpcH/HpaI aldolase family protein n=1 Tax=Rubripirellula obstinata TaxID=406547 RepID=UPI00135B5142|nr:aldolase/citrate lyase family protein [Rubripirellula obstinata]